MAKQRRVFMVAERVRELIAMELQRMGDPRFSLVTISSAKVSPDLRNAKVYWMVSDRKRIEVVEDAFEHANGFFRKLMAKELGTRFVPEIRFYYDDTLDTAEEVERLLARARGEETGGEAE